MEEYLIKALLCGSQTVESFRSHRTHSQLRQLPLSSFYSSACSNSGPIALLYRKYDIKQAKLPENYDSNILIFNCRGELIKMIPFELKERIILFQFNQEEQLIVIYATGQYFVIDTATAATVEGSYLAEGEDGKVKNRCMGAQLADQKVVIVRDKTLGVADELTSKWRSLPAVKLHSQFQVFESKHNEAHELEVVYLSHTYDVELYTVKKGGQNSLEVLFSHGEIRTLAPLLLSMSYKEGKLVLIFTDFLLWIDTKNKGQPRNQLDPNSAPKLILPSTGLTPKGLETVKAIFKQKVVFYQKFKIDKDDPITKTVSARRYRNFYSIGWINNVCYYSDRRHVFLTTNDTPNILEINAADSMFLLAQGREILRVIDEHTYVMRVINDPVYFSLSGQNEAVQNCLRNTTAEEVELYQNYKKMTAIYENVIERRPNNLQEVSELQVQSEKLLERLLKSVEEALDAGLQLKILKMAQWVQTMYHIKCDLNNLMIRLRVVNGLKYEHFNRWLSLREFQSLKNERFLHLLLRSNMHYVADLIFQDSQSKKKIFMHWAKCKIEKESPLNAIEQIKTKYQEMHVDLHSQFIFSELALYALKRTTPLYDLALRLAENQAYPSRKCIIFLLVFKNKKSLQLIDKILQFAEKSYCNAAKYRTLSTLRNLQSEVPVAVWMELLPKKPYLESIYLRMLKSEGNEQEIQKYYEINKKFTELAYRSLGQELKATFDKSMKAAVNIIQTQYAKILPGLAESSSKCHSRDWMERLREVKDRQGPVSQEDGVDATRDGELEFLGELAWNRDKNIALALTFYKRMKSDKVYEILKLKGRMKDAFEQAYERADKVKLQELMEECQDEEIVEYGHQLLSEMVKVK